MGWRHVHLADLGPTVTLGQTLDEAVDQIRGTTTVSGAIERAGEGVVLPAVRAALASYVDQEGAVRLGSAAWLVTRTA